MNTSRLYALWCLTSAFYVVAGPLRPSASGQVQDATRVRFVLAVDKKANLEGIEQSFEEANLIISMLKENQIRCVQELVDPNNVTPEAILNHIKNMDSRNDETLVFYYAGHGGTDPSYGHYFATSGGPLLRSAVRDAMVEKSPRLSILLTDCCSLSGRIKIVPAPRFLPPSEKFLKDLFLRHYGVVDITAATYRGPADSEAAFFRPRQGGVFTSALYWSLAEARTENFDTNEDGFFSWEEVYSKMKPHMNVLFKDFKDKVINGIIIIDDKVALDRLMRQEKQTPQAFSLGSRFAEPPAVRGAARPRHVRLGVLLSENYGFGVQVTRVIDETPATRVRVFSQANGIETERIASLTPGDTILSANGTQIHSIEQFLRVLDSVPSGGLLRFDGSDGGDNLRSTYRAEVILGD